MTGGAPILAPCCDTGILEDYHPAEERDDVFMDNGYVGHCSLCVTPFYVGEPRPVDKIPDAQEMEVADRA